MPGMTLDDLAPPNRPRAQLSAASRRAIRLGAARRITPLTCLDCARTSSAAGNSTQSSGAAGSGRLRVCSGCKLARFCGADCQRRAFTMLDTQHRHVCKVVAQTRAHWPRYMSLLVGGFEAALNLPVEGVSESGKDVSEEDYFALGTAVDSAGLLLRGDFGIRCTLRRNVRFHDGGQYAERRSVAAHVAGLFKGVMFVWDRVARESFGDVDRGDDLQNSMLLSQVRSGLQTVVQALPSCCVCFRLPADFVPTDDDVDASDVPIQLREQVKAGLEICRCPPGLLAPCPDCNVMVFCRDCDTEANQAHHRDSGACGLAQLGTMCDEFVEREGDSLVDWEPSHFPKLPGSEAETAAGPATWQEYFARFDDEGIRNCPGSPLFFAFMTYSYSVSATIPHAISLLRRANEWHPREDTRVVVHIVGASDFEHYKATRRVEELAHALLALLPSLRGLAVHFIGPESAPFDLGKIDPDPCGDCSRVGLVCTSANVMKTYEDFLEQDMTADSRPDLLVFCNSGMGEERSAWAPALAAIKAHADVTCPAVLTSFSEVEGLFDREALAEAGYANHVFSDTNPFKSFRPCRDTLMSLPDDPAKPYFTHNNFLTVATQSPQ
jgi:MSS51 C-terminal domain/MYND finger